MPPPKSIAQPGTVDLFGDVTAPAAAKTKPKAPSRHSRASGNPAAKPKGSYSLKKRQLSRSKIDLFIECPRCFVLEVKYNIKRVSGPAFTLNIAVDELFKNEFDIYRKAHQPHPEFAKYGIDAIPYDCPELDQWRQNFKGIRWQSKDHGWTFFGAVDDIWQAPDDSLIVADYKATSKAEAPTAETVYPGYKRQLEFYQFLLRRLGYAVQPTAWLVYANGIKTRERFDAKLEFDVSFIPHEGDDGWVAGALDGAAASIESNDVPEAATDCKWCQYRQAEHG